MRSALPLPEMNAADAAQDGAPCAQPVRVDPSRPDREHPAVFARGRLPARVTGFPYEGRARALTGDMAPHRTTTTPVTAAVRLIPLAGEGTTPDKARRARATEIE